jgi:TPR repeat protein
MAKLLIVISLIFSSAVSAVTQFHYSDSELEHYPSSIREDLKLGLTLYNQEKILEAFRQLEPLAEQDISEAQLVIGVIYIEGKKVPRDFRKAYEYLRRAALQGNVQAQYLAGMLLFNGFAGEKQVKCTVLVHLSHFLLDRGTNNCVEAYAWFNLAASQGDKESQTMLKENSRVLNSSQLIQAQELSTQYFSYYQKK